MQSVQHTHTPTEQHTDCTVHCITYISYNILQLLTVQYSTSHWLNSKVDHLCYTSIQSVESVWYKILTTLYRQFQFKLNRTYTDITSPFNKHPFRNLFIYSINHQNLTKLLLISFNLNFGVIPIDYWIDVYWRNCRNTWNKYAKFLVYFLLYILDLRSYNIERN